MVSSVTYQILPHSTISSPTTSALAFSSIYLFISVLATPYSIYLSFILEAFI